MLLNRLKKALLISSTDFDEELNGFIKSALLDLGVSGVDDTTSVNLDTSDELIIKAVITYGVYSFELYHGNITKAQAVKSDYESQKEILSHSTGYTLW